MKKKISLLLVMALLMTAFAACTEEAPEGEISDVEIEEPIEEVETYFTKASSPYDYEYTVFPWKKANMRFEVPKTWSLRFINSRYIRIDTPEGDGFMPGATINILCNYYQDVSENEISDQTLGNHAYRFSEIFKSELPGLNYTVDGKQTHLRKFVTEDAIHNGLEFTGERHEEDAATLVTDNAVMMDKSAHYYSGNSLVSTYVKWNDMPFCFSTVVKKEYADNARTMTEYIASSITTDAKKSVAYGTVEYEDFSTVVPTALLPVPDAENVFTSRLDANDRLSGMTIGVFKIDNKSMVTAENIANHFGIRAAQIAFGQYGMRANIAAQAEDADGGSGPMYKGNISINASGSEATKTAGTVFGDYEYFDTDYYVKDDGDAAYLVAVIYQKCQADVAKEAGQKAFKELKIGG